MALFSVTRYMGEDEEDDDSSTNRASSILQKIQAEAKVRKLQRLSGDKVTLQSKTSPTKTEKKKGKRKHSLEAGPVKTDTQDEEGEGISKQLEEVLLESRRHQGQKDLKSQKINAEITELGSDESILEESPKKKRKKKRDVEEGEVEEVNDSQRNKRKERKKEKRTDNMTDEERTSQREQDVQNVSCPQTHRKKRDKDKKVKFRSPDKNESLNDTIDENDKGDLDESQTEIKTVPEDGMEDENIEALAEGSQEIGGFTVLGDIKPKKTQKVHRVLPNWLTNPSVISADLRHKILPFSDVEGLDPDLVTKLTESGIRSFFPVQMQVIPQILEDIKYGYHVGPGGLRPSDICVSAPTGSGKTLAFVLPIVQALKKRVVCQVRALAVLPVRDLATQVFKVFQSYCKGTSLKVGLLVGQKPFDIEQQTLVRRRFRGYQSLVDIIVATPGRLVDHINKTEGFDLSSLRFLVIDEADRMMEEIKQDWLSQVEDTLYRGDNSTTSGRHTREVPGPLTAASMSKMQLPLQKMLFSATLSQNPEKLQQLNLFQPKLFTSVVTATKRARDVKPTVTAQNTEEPVEMGSPGAGEFVGKYTTPAGLTEYIVESSLAEKPLMVLHFLHNVKFRHVLCFTNSVEATHRLYWLVKLMGNIEVREFSSGQHGLRRDKILKQFEAGKIDIIICSDAMARGMDIDNVKYVVSYDPPPFIKTYIHRIGRTARAGKTGSAITLLQKKEFYHFKKMVKEAGKSNLQTMKVNKESLKPMIPAYQDALKELPQVLKGERTKKKSAR